MRHAPPPGSLPAFPWPEVDARFPAAANWLRFIDPSTPDEALLPAPEPPRPAPPPEVAAQWRLWQEALLSGQCPMARPRALVGDGPLPLAAPAFAPLAHWPALRRHCAQSWPAFTRWQREFYARLADVGRSVPGGPPSDAVRTLPPDRTARLSVVGLSAPAVLREQPGDATVTLGFIASARYVPWLRGFAAAAPPRRTPPGWFSPPVPADVGGAGPADIGGHRVVIQTSVFAQWLAFSDPGLDDAELVAAPPGRPGSTPGLLREWGRWRRRVMEDTPPGARREDLPAPPAFGPLDAWPAVRDHCRSSWRPFVAWLPGARRSAEGAASTAARRIDDLHALHPRWSKISLRRDLIEVAPVLSARVLVQRPGFAVVTAGLVAAPAFADWALEFTGEGP